MSKSDIYLIDRNTKAAALEAAPATRVVAADNSSESLTVKAIA